MDNSKIEAALERGVYTTFHQNQVSWRPASIGSKLVDLSALQLPTNSVLHVVDQFLANQVETVLPDLTNPLIHNESFQLLLETIQEIAGPGALFPVDDRYRFRPTQFMNEIRKFWIEHRNVKRPSSREAMLHQTNALPIINYNEILTAQMVGGNFQYYRKFDLLLRTILSTMSAISGKYQWLQIPLSRTVYRKVQFAQTVDDISYQTVRIKTDPSFYFLIHLINFVNKAASTSLFSQLQPDAFDTFNIILTAGEKAIIYNLGDLKAMVESRSDNNLFQLVLRHINTLKLAGHAEHDISELNDHDYDKLVDDIAPDDTIEHEAQTSSPTGSDLGQPKSITPGMKSPSPPPTADVEPETHSTEIPPVQSNVIHAPKPGKPLDPNSPTTSGKLPPSAAPTVKAVAARPPLSAVINAPQVQESLVEEIDRSAYSTIMAATQLSEDQKAAALTASQLYKTLLLDGRPIAEHLEQNTEPKISDGHLEFLKDKVVDASMLDSTAINLDKHYLDHFMAKDLASTLAHFATAGLFLIKIEQHDEVTQLDRIRHYKTVYQDLTGRRHTVSFKFPIVSSDGTIMINGIESRMIKQQVNLPICKIDSNRVSLASSYNKTLVERIGTRAHNFNAYICRYIEAVIKAQAGLQVAYGSLTSSVKLPYDYTSVARRYSSLSFRVANEFLGEEIYRFSFDYDSRFGLFHAAPYAESDSTFTHEGSLFDLTKLLVETAELPEWPFKVADLLWILQYADVDSERLRKADTNAPILVTRDSQDRLVVIDGFHRLTKAVAERLTEIPGKLVPNDMLMRHYIGKDEGPAGESLRPGVNRGQQPKAGMLKKALTDYEVNYGVYCGTARLSGYTYRMFFGYDNLIRFIGPNRGMSPVADQYTTPVFSLLARSFDSKVPAPKPLSEWTELKILDKAFPIVFILGFEFGLQRVIDHLQIPHIFVPIGTRIAQTPTTISVPFADGTLVFDRYPLEKSFVLSGLLKFTTKPYDFAAFNTKDVYYTLLGDSGISLNYLKGIEDFFRLFIDPITRDVLIRMHEPTTVGQLLLRATQMLTTEDAAPASSMANHRLRGYERFTTTLYNEMARSYASYGRQRGNRKSYSINPEAVFMRLIQDQTLHIVEEINPVENAKDKHAATYTGGGGRTAQSFVVEDRKFPEDGIGILSEATPYNSKVAINTYITASPRIANIRGMFDLAEKDPTTLEPSQVLSVPALLMPGSTNDDWKSRALLGV